MIETFLKNEGKLDSAISEAHVSAYLNKVGTLLFWALLFILGIEVSVVVLVNTGFFSTHMSIIKRRDPSIEAFTLNILIQNTLSWLVFAVYLFIYSKSKFSVRKVLVCAVFLIITSIFCFGLYRFSYLSFLYVLPIMVTCPLGKRCRFGTFLISILMTILYSFYQEYLLGNDFNFLINSVSLIALVATYLISRNIYTAFAKALLDINEYSNESARLQDDMAHDYLTGALSKNALHNDLLNGTDYISIAFLDLDNFKEINDQKGHSAGDRILKHLVSCFKARNERIYRYGGDEFVILSTMPEKDLANKMESIKKTFVYSAKSLYNCDTSFSAGITKIDFSCNSCEIIKQCDEVMYTSKNNGKNKITILKK